MAVDAAVFDAILADIASGLPVRQQIQAHGCNNYAFYQLVRSDEAASERYARAKSVAVEPMADEIIEIQDQKPPMVTTTVGGEEGVTTERVDTGWVAWQKNRVDTRKWLLAKLAPKKYGERYQHEGTEDGPPINLNVAFKGVTNAPR